MSYTDKLYVFDESFIPDKLILRERELNDLKSFAIPKWFGGSIVNAVYVSGEKGLGKTLTARVFKKYIEENNLGEVLYIPCKTSKFKTLKYFLLDECGISIDKKDVPLLKLRKAIELGNPKAVYFIFDDFQKLIYGRDELLFYTYETFLKLKKPLSIIVITQEPYKKFIRTISKDTLSRLRFTFVGFSPYNAEELKQIILQRLQYILKPEEYDLGAVNLIAAFVARIGGDARYALEIAKRTLTLGQFTLKNAEKAIRITKDLYWKQELLKLPPHTALYLYAMARCISQVFIETEGTIILSGNVRKEYLKLCEKFKVQPMSNRMITFSLNRLEKLGYIEKRELISRGRGKGSTRILVLTEKPINILRAARLINWETLLK